MSARSTLLVLALAVAPVEHSNADEIHWLGSAPCNAGQYVDGFERARQSPDFQRRCFEETRRLLRRTAERNADAEEASGIVRAMIQLDPRSAYAWAAIVELHLWQRRAGVEQISLWKVHEEAERATRGDPEIVQSWIALADLEREGGCLPCARTALDRADRVEPGNPDLLRARADQLSLEGKRAEAPAAYARALEASVTSESKAWVALALAEHHVRQKDWKAAESALTRAAMADPQSPMPQLRLASFLLYQRGNEVGAIQAADRAFDLQPSARSRRLASMARYLRAAKEYQRTGDAKHIRATSQRELVTPEEAYILAAEYPVLVPITMALTKTHAVQDVDARDGQGDTALIAAAQGNNLALMKTLLASGADPNAENSHGERALTFAAAREDPAAARLLLERNVDPNYADVDLNSPLTLAVLNGRGRVVALLLQSGATLSASERWTSAMLLSVACENADVESVKVLVEHGADPNAADPEGKSPLISAVLAGSGAAAAYLLDRGADPDARFHDRSAMDYARDRNDWAVVRLLESRLKKSI